jgi:hypothetical protein
VRIKDISEQKLCARVDDDDSHVGAL